jgi:hypothetical protein
MTAFIDHTELTANPQKIGLVARANLDWGGAIQGWQFEAGESGYAAVVTYYPATPSGYPTTVTLYKLTSDCLFDAAILRVSPTFMSICEDQHFLTFDVFESGSQTVLLATLSSLDASDPSIKHPIAISAGTCPVYSTDSFTLCAVDASSVRPRSGYNGVVGHAVGSDAVYWEDVSISDVTTATFDTLSLGTTIGASTGASPGDHWFDIPADLDSNGVVDLADLAALLIERYRRPNSTLAFGNATIQAAGANFGAGRICHVDLGDLAILLNATTSLVEIDYQHSGAPCNLGVNTAPLYVGTLSAAPQNIAPGVRAKFLEGQVGPTTRGRVTLQSVDPDDLSDAIATVRIGGESISFDNIRIVSDAHTFDCVADLDDGSGLGVPDGGVGIEDLLHYLTLYDQGLLPADVDDGSGTGNFDGGVGIEDLLYFLERYDEGC